MSLQLNEKEDATPGAKPGLWQRLMQVIYRQSPALFESIRGLPVNVYKSIYRTTAFPKTERERSEAFFNSFLLHIQPVKIQRHALRYTYTFGLGLISLYLFGILSVTGVLLMFYYVPSTHMAYQRMLDLSSSVSFGQLLRNMHRWAAHMMVATVFLHMCRVFYTGAYKPPREFNWVVGVILLVVTCFLSFTGYLLPWDQLAYWAVEVGTSIAGYTPYFGHQIKWALLGGRNVGQETLIRFYVLHVAVLPLLATCLIVYHFWRIRKDGGISGPEDDESYLERMSGNNGQAANWDWEAHS